MSKNRRNSMTDYATSNGYPDRVERTPKGKLTFDRLHICAKKAIDPCTDADCTLSNAIAAVHLENSKITSPDFVRLSKQAHHKNGSVLRPPLAAVPAAKTTTPCTGQKTPIQSTCRSFSSSSQSNNPQTIGSSSDDAGHTDSLLSHKSVNHSPMAQQPSSRDFLLSPSQASSFQTTVSPSDATGLINFLLLPKSVARSSPVVPQQQPPIHKIFLNNVAKPVLRSSLPELAFIFKSTRQLAFGLSLLTQELTSSSSLIATQGKTQGLVLTKDERAWVVKMRMSTEEHGRLRWLAAQVATQFLKRQHKAAGFIEEVMLLGAVLERKEYRGVLSALIGQLEREKLMDVDLLQALVQFLQSAPPKHLVDDDFVRILRVLRGRLKNTHKALNDKNQPRSDHVYHLSTAIARVLDAMIAGEIHGLDRTEDYLPLSDLLTELKECLDPYLKFQATYAWQALQYVGDDETPLHAVLRFGGGVTKAALGVAGVFKLDPENLFNGLRELGQAAGQAYEVVKTGMEGAQAFRAGGEGVVDSMLKGFRSGAKQSWYPALQGARGLIGEGRLADFERVIYEAPCCREPEFQMGVCQLLGEVAVDPIWELRTRLQAVDLLRQLNESDTGWVANTCVKDGILGILLYLSMTEDDAIQLQTAVILEDLAYDRVGALPGPYPLVLRLPIPTASPLLEKALKIQSTEHNLLRMKTLRLAHYDQAIYIPPLAKANPQTPEEEATPLMDQVKEFLDSDKQVFLVIGDSGSGKSTFNLHLEHTLWKAYEQGDPHIPLYIHLSTSRYLSSLIDEQLTKHHFDDLAIQDLKLASRKFIVICDGYDEARLTTNLHSSNGWNRPFGWNTKMVVSCRSTHLGREYHARFQPTPSSPYCDPLPHLFQEAVIVPFSQDQVKEYVEQFVRDPTVHGLFCRKEVQWSAEKYLDMIKRIPNLAELVKNPFLLTLALRALPDVVIDDGEGRTTFTTTDENATAGVAEMTRSQLYKSFVHQWLEINKRRLTTSLTLQCPTTAYTLTTSTATAASTLQELIDEGFQDVALDFLQSLAAAIYKHQRGKPIVEYWHRFDKTTWKADFFGPALNITLLRESSPLTKVENLHFFLHRSLLEYFYSCHLSRTTRSRYGIKESAIAEAVSMEQSWGTNNHQVNGAKPIVRVPQMTVPDTPTVSSPPPSAENVPETKASAVDTDANKAGTGPQPVPPLPPFKELALTTPPKDISIPPALPMESIKSALPETVQIKKNSRAEKWLTNAVKDKQVRMIPFSDISKVKYNVAKGGSGTIHFGCWRGMHIAIKEQHSTHDLIKELKMHKQVHDAEYIVKHFGITKHPLTHDTCIVMQFAGNGCLQDFLKTKNSSITWLKKYHLAWEIASGLDFIHREDIFHTNLHSRNILIDSRGKALITDFGLSKSVNNTIYTTKSGLFGVVPYVAPERMQNPTYTYNAKCDIYSLGVILWELSSCVIPFEAQLQDVMLAVNIIAGVREKTVPGTAVEYEMLYRRCWDGLPQNRPNMEFVLSELNGPLVAGESMIAPSTPFSYDNDVTIQSSLQSMTHMGPASPPSQQPPAPQSISLGLAPKCQNIRSVPIHDRPGVRVSFIDNKASKDSTANGVASSMEQSRGAVDNYHQINSAKPNAPTPPMPVPDSPTVSSSTPPAENISETKASAVDTDANKAGTGPQPLPPLPSFKELALTTPPKDINIPPALPMESINSALPETASLALASGLSMVSVVSRLNLSSIRNISTISSTPPGDSPPPSAVDHSNSPRVISPPSNRPKVISPPKARDNRVPSPPSETPSIKPSDSPPLGPSPKPPAGIPPSPILDGSSPSVTKAAQADVSRNPVPPIVYVPTTTYKGKSEAKVDAEPSLALPSETRPAPPRQIPMGFPVVTPMNPHLAPQRRPSEPSVAPSNSSIYKTSQQIDTAKPSNSPPALRANSPEATWKEADPRCSHSTEVNKVGLSTESGAQSVVSHNPPSSNSGSNPPPRSSPELFPIFDTINQDNSSPDAAAQDQEGSAPSSRSGGEEHAADGRTDPRGMHAAHKDAAPPTSQGSASKSRVNFDNYYSLSDPYKELSQDESSDFITAVAQGDLEMIERLLKAHPYLLHESIGLWPHPTPILLAARSTHAIETMKVLIKHGAALDRGDHNGTTVLHFVCEQYSNPTEAVIFLTKAGADCNSRDSKKRTPLMVLLQNSHITSTKVLIETMRVLFKLGAHTKVVDHQHQRTPLHYAVQHCKEPAPVIELLLENGAEVNAIDSRKSTPLHMVLEKMDNEGIVQMLLLYGADPSRKNGNKRNALCVAAENLRLMSACFLLENDLLSSAPETIKKANELCSKADGLNKNSKTLFKNLLSDWHGKEGKIRRIQLAQDCILTVQRTPDMKAIDQTQVALEFLERAGASIYLNEQDNSSNGGSGYAPSSPGLSVAVVPVSLTSTTQTCTPQIDYGLMESVDLEEEPEVLQFLVERAREDEKYRVILGGYVAVDVEEFAAPKALRNAKRILELAGV